MITFKFHIGDWIKHTHYLSHVERSMYMQMMVLYYMEERPLSESVFIRRCNARTEEEVLAIRFVLNEYFQQDGDVWRHVRCDKEIQEVRGKSKVASDAGRKSGESRRRSRAVNETRTDVPEALNEKRTEGKQIPDEKQTNDQRAVNETRTDVEQNANERSTDVQQKTNGCSTNVANPLNQPITNNLVTISPPVPPPRVDEREMPREPVSLDRVRIESMQSDQLADVSPWWELEPDPIIREFGQRAAGWPMVGVHGCDVTISESEIRKRVGDARGLDMEDRQIRAILMKMDTALDRKLADKPIGVMFANFVGFEVRQGPMLNPSKPNLGRRSKLLRAVKLECGSE